MRIRIVASPPSECGQFECGRVYDVSETLATAFIESGTAVSAEPKGDMVFF